MSQYLLEYEWALAQYLGYGVAACYRGPRLYDSVKSMTVAQKWVGFYKRYRDIVTSDIVHVRRPDMQSKLMMFTCHIISNLFPDSQVMIAFCMLTHSSLTED